MSTLVNILLATVLNFLAPANTEVAATNDLESCIQLVEQDSALQFEEHTIEHIISKDEQSSLKESTVDTL